eukprot:TRINITY_DN3196_c0_g1_i2.p1 TRINITY_DN3196_c0_g1~~TRINITY_DN3196_c0_g1_i2.p1  ORF type:complete len:291 (-),score=58.12 TRINITY_DN3196_c0_g1_i2:107-979(-)
MSADERKKPALSPTQRNIVAGAIAGVTEVLIMYPLDVVKTRLQLQTAASSQQYTGVGNAFRTIVQQEGFFSLYRGIISPILAEAPKRAAKFTFNELYKGLLVGKEGKLVGWKYAAAGSLAGMSEALINCPFEVVKVRMQAKENLALYRSTTDAAIGLLKKEGPLALYQGLESQLWRNGVWNGAYFGIIPIVKQAIPVAPGSSETWRNFLAGFIAGTVATTLNTPFDVVKSRLQKGGKEYAGRWTFPLLVDLARQEGPRALFKGYVPRILRLGPGGGIMILAFDYVNKWLA